MLTTYLLCRTLNPTFRALKTTPFLFLKDTSRVLLRLLESSRALLRAQPRNAVGPPPFNCSVNEPPTHH